MFRILCDSQTDVKEMAEGNASRGWHLVLGQVSSVQEELCRQQEVRRGRSAAINAQETGCRRKVPINVECLKRRREEREENNYT